MYTYLNKIRGTIDTKRVYICCTICFIIRSKRSLQIICNAGFRWCPLSEIRRRGFGKKFIGIIVVAEIFILIFLSFRNLMINGSRSLFCSPIITTIVRLFFFVTFWYLYCLLEDSAKCIRILRIYLKIT